MKFLKYPVTVKSEPCDELKVESFDYNETIKIEIKEEIQETEGDLDPLSTKGDFQDLSIELSSVNEMSIEDIV